MKGNPGLAARSPPANSNGVKYCPLKMENGNICLMKAILISTGDELTCGRAVNTNSAWLAGKLLELGIQTVSHHTVGDDAAEIASAIRDAAARAKIVLVTDRKFDSA